jgi:hypothetical protein
MQQLKESRKSSIGGALGHMAKNDGVLEMPDALRRAGFDADEISDVEAFYVTLRRGLESGAVSVRGGPENALVRVTNK